MRKVLALVLVFVLCLSLCACGGGTPSVSESTRATKATEKSETPKSSEPTKGNGGTGATQGSGAADCETDGHDWEEATCSTPKTCKTCGETNGTVSDHKYEDGKCTMCESKDPKAEQISNATAAYGMLLLAEGYCDLFSEMIGDAWYFAIYKSDDYYTGDSAISAFSSYVGIEKALVQEGVDSYLTKLGYTTSSTYRAAALSTNSGALYVVDYALTKNETFKNAKDCIDSAKKYIGKLDSSYSSVNAYTEVVAYYSAVSTYFDFCCSPSGSYSQLSSTLSTFRNNCATNRNLCDLKL